MSKPWGAWSRWNFSRAWPRPNQAGSRCRDCVQAKTQGMARRSRRSLRSPSAGGARAEANVLDQIDGRRLAEVFHKFRRLINEFAVEIAAAGGELRGIAFPFRDLGRFDPAEVEQVRVEHRGDQLLEIPLGDGGVRVFQGNHFALFGDAQPPARRRERLRLNAAMRLPAAAVDGPPLAVEQGEAHAVFFRHLRQALLGVEELPIGRHVTAVFDGVRIPQHHFLKVLARAQNAAVKRIGEQLLHDSRARFQIVERFEQRNDIEVGASKSAAAAVPQVPSAAPATARPTHRRRWRSCSGRSDAPPLRRCAPGWCGGREIPPARGAWPAKKVGAGQVEKAFAGST